MSIKEIENAITKLSNDELIKLSAWFADYRSRIWDEQIERDLEMGKLDKVIAEVDAEYEAGNAEPL